MKKDLWWQNQFDRWFENFFAPFIMGGQMQIWKPITPPMLEIFKDKIPSNNDLLTALSLKRISLTSEILNNPLNIKFDSEDIIITSILYNFFVYLNPQTRGFARSKLGDKSLNWANEFISLIKPADSINTLIGRFTLLKNVFSIIRYDYIKRGERIKKYYTGVEHETSLSWLDRLRKLSVEKLTIRSNDINYWIDIPIRDFLNNISPLTVLWDINPFVLLKISPAFFNVFSNKEILRALSYRHSIIGINETLTWLANSIENEITNIHKMNSELLKILFILWEYMTYFLDLFFYITRSQDELKLDFKKSDEGSRLLQKSVSWAVAMHNIKSQIGFDNNFKEAGKIDDFYKSISLKIEKSVMDNSQAQINWVYNKLG